MGSIIIRKQILWDPYRWQKIFPEWVENMDPEKDRLLLTWMANHALEPGRNAALRKLGVTEAPPFPWIRHPDCDREEQYWILSGDKQYRIKYDLWQQVNTGSDIKATVKGGEIVELK